MRLIPRHRHHRRREGSADRDQRGGDQRRPALPGAAARRAPHGRRPEARGPVSDNGVVTAPEGTAAEVAEAFAASDPGDSRSRTLVWQDPVPTAAAGATMTGMEYMTAVVTGEMPPPPIAVTMRLRPVELEEGRVVFEGEPGEEHYNPIGVVHGGYAATLLDSRPRLRRPHDAAGRCRLHLARPRGEVRAPDHPRHRPRPLRGDRPLPRPQAGDRRGDPDRGRQRQAARPRHRHLHDPRRRGLGGAVARELDQQPHAEAAGVVADVLAADVPGGAGDVEVRPGRLADELLEEGGGGDRPRLALLPRLARSATVPFISSLYSGWSGSRQTSSPVASPAAVDLGGELVVVGDQAGVGRAEGDDDGAGQGGEVDDPLGARARPRRRGRRRGSAGPRRRCC